MVCGTCGYNNADTALYCSNCGAPLKTDSYGTTVDNKFNTQNSFYVQDGVNNQNVAGTQNTAYAQNGMGMQNNMYPQNGYGVQGNYYGQSGIDELDSLLKTNNKTVPNRMNVSEYMKLPALANVHKSITGAAVAIYIMTVISVLIGVLQGNYWGFLDFILLIVLAALVQFKGSLVASYMLLVYGIFNTILYIFAIGFPAGFGFIIAGVCAVIATNKLRKSYKEYVKTGYIPNNMVL